MDEDLAPELAQPRIVTREDLAEQAIDELAESTALDAERAGELIMARAQALVRAADSRPERSEVSSDGAIACRT